MRRLLLLFILLGSHIATSGAEDKIIQLPYQVEMGKPIAFSLEYDNRQSGTRMLASEQLYLTPLKNSGDEVIYSVESAGAEVKSMEGMPPGLSDIVKKLVEDVSGLQYKYAADNTGYPLQLVESRDIRKFMKKVKGGMNQWLNNFASDKDLNAEQKALMQSVMDQGLAPFMTEDNDELSQLILEDQRLIFSVTARELYVDYQTVSEGSHYFEDGEISLSTEEYWQIDEINEKAGTIKISMQSALHSEEYPAFISQLRDSLQSEYSAEEVEQIVAIWEGLELNRSAAFVVDLKNGLPLSGTIRSETSFNNESSSETIDFVTAL